jgi:hypothetical protein
MTRPAGSCATGTAGNPPWLAAAVAMDALAQLAQTPRLGQLPVWVITRAPSHLGVPVHHALPHVAAQNVQAEGHAHRARGVHPAAEVIRAPARVAARVRRMG